VKVGNIKNKYFKEMGVLILLASFYASNAVAVSVSPEIQNGIVEFLQDSVMKNVGYVAGLAAIIVTSIAAVGTKLGPIITDNIAKVGYYAFGGTGMLWALSAAGANI
jgi:hypothetical protein